MQQTELFRILETFTENEQDQFICFLQSPFCTDGKDESRLVRMCSFIFDCMNQKKIESLTEEQLYAHTYPNVESKGKNLKNRRSEALQYVKSFLVLSDFKTRKNETDDSCGLIRQYTKRKLFHNAEREIKKIRKWQKNPRIQWEIKDFHTCLSAKLEETNFQKAQTGSNDPKILYELLTELTNFYHHHKFYFSTLLLSSNYLFNFNDKPYMDIASIALEEQNKDVQKYLSTEHGKLQGLLYRIIHPLIENTMDDFGDLQDILFEKKYDINQEDFMSFYKILIYCVFKNRTLFGDQYLNTIVNIQKKEFEPDFPSFSPNIPASKLYSFIYHSLRIGDIASAKEIFEKYKDKISDTELTEETENYCTMAIAFAEERYDDAYDMFIVSKFSDNRLKYLSRILEGKLFYTIESKISDTKAENVVRGMRRIKYVNEDTSEALKTFGNFLLRMINSDFGFKKSYTERVLLDAQSNEVVAEKEWIVAEVQKALVGCVE